MPDVMIFDLTDACESHILPLLFKNPDLVMVGLDPECNQVMLVSGQEAQSLTLDQIREIAEARGDVKGGDAEHAQLNAHEAVSPLGPPGAAGISQEHLKKRE